MLVFGGRAVLNEIPGDDGHIGSRRQSVKLNDRARQAGSRVDAAPIGSGTWRGGLLWRVKQLPRRQDMAADRHFRELEADVAARADHLGADLDQLAATILSFGDPTPLSVVAFDNQRAYC
jgi:hypothetical protein